jgi:hypothetical protein
MKTVVCLLVAVVLCAYVGGFLTPSTAVHAQTVEQASGKLVKTERDLRNAAEAANNDAAIISQGLSSRDRTTALPKELEDFTLSTQRLVSLRSDLEHDIGAYETAYQSQLVTFDQERSAITDASTLRSMDVLRRHTEQDMHERIMKAKAALGNLDNVLAKGSDLQHAAKCVLIAQDVHAHGEDLDNQLKATWEQAADYRTVTTSLLDRIHQAIAD